MSDPHPPLVPGIEGDTIMAQIQKLFEPPGNSVSSVCVDGVGDPGDLYDSVPSLSQIGRCAPEVMLGL